MKKGVLIGMVALVVFAGVTAGSMWTWRGARAPLDFAVEWFDSAKSDSNDVITVAIEPGTGVNGIADALQEAGIIKSSFYFRFLVAFYDMRGELEAGVYQLRPNMKNREIIQALRHGRDAIHVFTVPEGWQMGEIGRALQDEGIGQPGDFEAACSLSWTYSVLADVPAGASLEGYLAPDTYYLPHLATAELAVQMMLENFESRFTPAMRQQAAAMGLSVHQVVTLASIVEREAKLAAERPVIARVFLNRLDADIQLAADPTVQYALSRDPVSVAQFGYWKAGLSAEDLQIQSPYNTYVQKGLPPGPICNPGLDSINAVLNPDDNDYLYFVARPDGSHVFSRTYEEHLANVDKYGQQ